jgi:deoxyribonuclease V
VEKEHGHSLRKTFSKRLTVISEMQIVNSRKITYKEAIDMQAELRTMVSREDGFGETNLIAGVDLSFHRADRTCRAAMVLLNMEDMSVVAQAALQEEVAFPYVPGLLAFREAPAIIHVYEKLRTKPDLLMLDGQGYAHPRRFGVACHVGVALNIPSIGCAKSRLIGRYEDPGQELGTSSPLIDNGEVIGAALRTKICAKPVFISIGHRICLESAIRLTMECIRNYRLPEPTRLAHQLAAQWE